ncbi:unnamed protein product [Phaedon cochleariae]|uniref:RCC1 domain-containing protein 1 n=1 Tax=Phaedon cochleariae TaxID=80249 RepID=A0A9P0GWF3_PHACE|nr:unnamed protein product [Phaedon cochleariae]
MRVFCNGLNLYGQLNTNKAVVGNLEPVFEFEVIRKMCINYCFSVILTSDDCLICWKNEMHLVPRKSGETILHVTSNDERIISLSETGKLAKSDLDKLCDFKEMMSILSCESAEEKIINVSSCSKLTVAYSNKGAIFNIPNRLHFINPHIVDVKCGREHCLLLDQFGTVYSFGRGSRGQLGHGKLDDEEEPVLVEALAGIKITQISAGGWHSGALSQDGDLYIWGWNGNGQLGLCKRKTDDRAAEDNSVSVMATPHVVDFEDSERNVIKVACGGRHTLALLDNNHLFGCGWNKYKQLKNLEDENISVFTYLHDFEQDEVVDIACGPWNSAVICR